MHVWCIFSNDKHEKKQDIMHSSFVSVFLKQAYYKTNKSFSGLKYVEYRDDGMIQNNTIKDNLTKITLYVIIM